ncbi:zf-HC2 domain-containing protein [Amycolatopsis sp. H20-H5]|uniref:zf-HC2 domain-containing protein n=1 Tax=Amycolatopsis sp. H20-H5 TaxID=3046309 RepID=UPI002DC05997|nr:zf-HC2 domain-containing protein [Amycolatopsis sp. H20-H5]MEC3975848.1 zf-HC2 domain-containing protein [Amycolatopsis sp. H20-H5]
MTWFRRSGHALRPLNCMQVARTLQSYLDGAVDDHIAARAALHLEDCRRCGLKAETYREIKAALGRREQPAADAVERLRDFGTALLSAPDNPRA